MSPLITLTDVTKAFGAQPLFTRLTLSFRAEDRTALIGPNGSGKSTLLKILAGVEEIDDGEISQRRGLRAAYVPQEESFPATATVESILRASFLPDQSDSEALLSKYSALAGFSDLSLAATSLSGGWQKRLSLIAALMRQPELLLLDEPTNHLDIDSILWLEKLLLEQPLALIVVSHDRYFIERIAKEVIEIDQRYPKGFLSAKGSYGDFLQTRATFFEQRQSYKDSLANKVRREVEWLRQGAKARTTKSKGRIKQAGELIKELGAIDTSTKKAKLEFSNSARKTKELIKIEKLGKAIAGKQLFSNLTFTITPGTRLGVVGANGSGKTALLKILTGELEPDSGDVRLAPRLRAVYFDQHRRQLDPTQTLAKALSPEGDTVVFNDQELHVASWARRFLFRGDQLVTTVGSLSGGEQARVMLAKMMLEPADVLILDEPTNDLDIATLEVLEDAIDEFPGAVILVSHDRHLLDQVCTNILGLEGRQGCALYADYTQWELLREKIVHKEIHSPKQKLSAAQAALAAVGASEEAGSQSPPIKLSPSEKKELDYVERRIQQVESRVAALELEISKQEVIDDALLLKEKCEQLTQLQGQIEEIFSRWQELEEKHNAYQAWKKEQG